MLLQMCFFCLFVLFCLCCFIVPLAQSPKCFITLPSYAGGWGKTYTKEKSIRRKTVLTGGNFGIATLGGISGAVWRKLGINKNSGLMKGCFICVMDNT